MRLISPQVFCTSITNRVLSWFGCFRSYYKSMRKNVTKLISPRDLCTNVTNRVLRWFDRFTAYYYIISRNVKNLISPRDLCTSIKTVLLADLNVLQLVRIVWAKISSKLMFPRVQCTSITDGVSSWFEPFYGLLELYEQKCHKTHISASSVHMCQKSCSWLFWPFYSLLQLYKQKYHKLISPRVLCTSVTYRVLSWFDRFRLFTTVWAKMSQSSHFREFCTQVSQIVFLADLTVLWLS